LAHAAAHAPPPHLIQSEQRRAPGATGTISAAQHLNHELGHTVAQKWESLVRITPIILLAASALVLAACGTTEKTVVVQPAAGQTVVVPPSGDVRVAPNPN
jgi:hypothetical protein